MPSPELFRYAPEGGGSGPEPREHEPVPYYRAARFERERRAERAYVRVQEMVLHASNEVDLSTYRLLLNQVSHVVVLGEPPPEGVDRQLGRILSAGAPATLPADVLQILAERRARATKLGPWLEGHYRPGRPL